MKKLLFTLLFLCVGISTQAESISEKAQEEIAVFGCEEDCAQNALLMGESNDLGLEDQYTLYMSCSAQWC